jgi:hypothetical protein
VVNTLGTDPGGARTERSFGAREFSKEVDQRTGFASEDREIPLTVGSWRSCAGVSPKAQKGTGRRISAYRASAFDEARISCSLKSRVAISRINGSR